MIVDDNPEIHGLLRARLESRGFVVRSADDGGDVVAQFEDFSPDVTFLDVTMSHLGGLNVLRAIRARNLDMAVVLTAAVGLEQRTAIGALRDGADDYLRKPFDGDEFQAALDRTITRLTLARQNAALRRHLGIELAPDGATRSGPPPPADPRIPGFELAARSVPAAEGEVSGDFYDWQELGSSALSLVVGDVMGKGMPAALMKATVRAVLRAVVSQNAPAAALQRVAQALDPDLARSGSFVTVFHAQLDIATARLSCSDAGHGFVLFRRANGTVEELRRIGLPLGIVSNEVYREDSILFDPGDVLVVYSDGLTQALPDLLTNRSLLAASIDGANSAAGIADGLLDLGCRSGPLIDDLTIAVLLRNGAPDPPAGT